MDDYRRYLRTHRLLEAKHRSSVFSPAYSAADFVGRHSEGLLINKPEQGEDSEWLKAKAYLDGLNSLMDEELGQKFSELLEAQHPLNHPELLTGQADCQYWVKISKWEPTEAAALLLEHKPDGIDISAIKKAWNKCTFAQEFLKLKRLIESERWKSNLPINASPREYLEWAKSLNIPIPEELEKAAANLIGVNVDTANSSSNNPKKILAARERDTLLKLVLGMALEQYGLNPRDSRSKVTANICDDLDGAGLSLDPKTVRKYLREAVELHWDRIEK